MKENKEDINAKIKDSLLDLNNRQIVSFSWLCAVRALPFLGAFGEIDFWQENIKIKCLYNIIRSIDIACAAIEHIRPITATDAATAIIIADNVDSVYTDSASEGVKSAVNAIAYAAYSAYAAYADTSNEDSVCNAACTVAADVAVYAYNAAKYNSINLLDILFDDIRYIKANTYNLLHHDTNLYGSIWNKFQDALIKEGCEYWSQIFTELFSSGFTICSEVLERRLNIPVEIQEQGAKIAGLYLEKLELQGIKCLNEARIIILGEKGAGKTCLARRLNNLNAPMTEKEESTDGVTTTIWKTDDSMEESNSIIHIWDFAGHVITHAAHRCFLSERCLYIIVYDGRTEERNRLNYWLEHVRNYGSDAPVRILVNMFDEHKPDIPENTLMEKYPNIKDFTYLSINKDKTELKKFRDETSSFIQNNPLWNCLEIPLTYHKVKEDLERRFQNDSEHISKDIFDQITAKNNIDESSAKHLLNDLHELGICLWYHDIEEFDTLVLNPDWISHGIYKLINWAHDHAKHTVSLDDYEEIFLKENIRYPKDKLLFIFRLMKKYELAYSKEIDSIITIPFLLREDQPKNLPFFSLEDSLLIQYVAEQPLPPNTVSRLIVRHNEDIRDTDEIWRYGVVLKYKKDTVALVKEDDRKIIIKVKGNDKSEYIAKLRSTMNDIFSSYKGDKPELMYKIISNNTVITNPFEKDEIMLSDEIIRSYIANGRINYYYPQANHDIPLDKTVNIYNINTSNAAFGSSQIVNNTFNFYNCNLALQGELKSMINSLNANGHADKAVDLESVMSDLEKAENLDTKKDIIKSGCMVKLKNFLDDLGNEKSSTRKIIGGMKFGIKTAKDIAKSYNNIAGWVGLPQVPKLFLGD